MTAVWPSVALGEVVTQRKEFVVIDDLLTYKRPRVQLHAKGIVLRDEISGALIKTKKQQVVQAGEFLVAEIDAKMGGFGIVPSTLDGAIVSSHYFLFRSRPHCLDERYLGWFIKTPAFRDQVEAQGSTNYAAIRPTDILLYQIPLPPLSEQRRIVGRIEALNRQVAQAIELRRIASQESEALVRSILFRDASVSTVPMRELVRQRTPDVLVRPSDAYHFAGVYSFGRGVFAGIRRQGIEFAYRRLTRLQAGNFVYPKLMAWEGALGVVPDACDGLVVSPEFPVFDIDEGKVLPEVLDIYFTTPSVWPRLSGVSTGTNVRRRRLNPSEFLNYQFPLPSRGTQMLLREVKRNVDLGKKLQQETDVELKSMIPSILQKAFSGEL